MRIFIDRGYISFYPDTTIERSSLFDNFSDLEIEDNGFTFSFLKKLENVSFKNLDYGNLKAKVNFSSENKADILEANNFLFDLKNRELVEKSSIKKVFLSASDTDIFKSFLNLPISGTYIKDENNREKQIKTINLYTDDFLTSFKVLYVAFY